MRQYLHKLILFLVHLIGGQLAQATDILQVRYQDLKPIKGIVRRLSIPKTSKFTTPLKARFIKIILTILELSFKRKRLFQSLSLAYNYSFPPSLKWMVILNVFTPLRLKVLNSTPSKPFKGKRYRHLTLNIAEVFNSKILAAREMPILAMLKKIRYQLMDWFAQ